MAVGTQNEATRVAWIEQTLQKIPAGARLLDAGAGERQFERFCAHLRYVAQDFAQYDGQGDGTGLQTGSWDQSKLDIVSDIARIPEPDASFDAIMCTEVFEHIPHPAQAMAEFARLLRPGGWLLITAPFCSLTHFAPYHFYTGFSKYFYDHYLAQQETRRIPNMAGQHASGRLRLHERLALRVLLGALGRFSAADSDSAEILCFGCHVFARKRGAS